MLQFDFASFLLGFVTAAFLAAALYRQRAAVAAMRDRLAASLRRLRERLTANIESRYQAALLAHLDRLHLAQNDAPFDALYVDQLLDAPPVRPSLTPPNADVFSPVNFSAALRSTRRLIITGSSGAGRTTALSQIARIHAMRQAQTRWGLDAERLPVLVNLPEVDWTLAHEANPLPALLDGATVMLPRLIAANAGRFINGRLRTASALLLLDGFDELTPAQRLTCTSWLAALLKLYPETMTIIVTGSSGYGPLQNLGFAPLSLAAWTPAQIDDYAAKWVTVMKGGKQDRQLLSTGLRALAGLSPSPIDLALAASVWRATTTLPPNRAAVFEQWIDRALETGPAKGRLTPDQMKSICGRLALTLFQQNRADFSFDDLTQQVAAELPSATGDAARQAEQAAELAHEVIDRVRILTPFGVDGWSFVHRELAAFLAARHAAHTGQALGEYVSRPEWAGVLDFHAVLVDPAELVNKQLAAADDLGRQQLWQAARWTGHASLDAPWRSKVMGEMARLLVQPDQIPQLRERALTGLLATRDKGLPFLLKRVLAHPDAAVRALGVRGLQHLGREVDLPLFVGALNDSSADVRLAAVQALGALAQSGVYPAVEQLIKLLVEADEDTRRLAAELLAGCGEEGYQILREGAAEDDLKVRRAAAYGLAATGQDWARDLLHKLERDDTQWFVRSAATDALGLMQRRNRAPTETPPLDLTPVVIDQQGWLVEWAARQGIGIGVGRQATTALLRALTEGDLPARLAALQTLRHNGDWSHHDALRGLLTDPDRTVREAAFAALETIGQRAGQPVPR